MNKTVTMAANLEVAAYYDELPYQSFAFPQSAPEHLASVANLFGVKAPEVATARVLELGCASGGNLLPFASRHPKARVVGVDISKVHIQQANTTLEHMGLNNIRFVQKDLSQIDASFGTFDYIICHGVYSWVPEEVQEAIHRIVGECLAKTGVAYISYNTYPGWKAREIVRDAMLFRGGDRKPLERLSFARGMVDFMHKMAQPSSALKVALDEIKSVIDNSAPYYLLHDFLEPFNIPVYFHEFVTWAEASATSYLADTNVSTMFASNYGSDIATPLLKECTTQPMLEQYLDFITNRAFRQSLLVHSEQASKIRYRLDGANFAKFFYAGFFELDNSQRKNDDSANKKYYQTQIGSIFITGSFGHAIAKAFNDAWPATLSFETLLTKLVKATSLDKEECRIALQDFVEEGIIKGYLRFRSTPVNCTSRFVEKPEICPALRKVLDKTSVNPVITVWNNWHEAVTIDAFEALIARRLDGKHTVKDILREVQALLEAHIKAPQQELVGIADPEDLKTNLKRRMTTALARLVKCALLVKK